MSKTGAFNGTITIAGTQIQANTARVGEGGEGWDIPMAAGVAGELTNRTDDDEATLTLPEGSFETGDILGVFWNDDDDVPCGMYGFAGTVSGTSVAIAPSGTNYTGACPTGTVLPAEGTPVVVSKKVVRNIGLEADDVIMIGVGCDQRAVGILGAAAAIYPADIAVAYSPILWDKASGASSPLTADPTTLVCYNGGIVAATFQCAFLLNPAT